MKGHWLYLFKFGTCRVSDNSKYVFNLMFEGQDILSEICVLFPKILVEHIVIKL